MFDRGTITILIVIKTIQSKNNGIRSNMNTRCIASMLFHHKYNDIRCKINMVCIGLIPNTVVPKNYSLHCKIDTVRIGLMLIVVNKQR